MSVMTKMNYDELNSYEPMQYRPEDWEKFHAKQLKEYAWFEKQLAAFGFIEQIGKIAVLNEQDFLDKKESIEAEEGFVRWFELK